MTGQQSSQEHRGRKDHLETMMELDRNQESQGRKERKMMELVHSRESQVRREQRRWLELGR
jgi:hypothetical protein